MLRHFAVGCATWGVVAQGDKVLCGSEEVSVANSTLLWDMKVGDAVCLVNENGAIKVKKGYSHCSWVPASVTTDKEGRGLFSASNTYNLDNCVIYPNVQRTVCFKAPKPFLLEAPVSFQYIYIPDTDITADIRPEFDYDKTIVITGEPDFNKVKFVGGSVMRSAEFVHIETDQLFTVDNGAVYSAGLLMLTRDVMCKCESGKMFVPEKKNIEVRICNPKEGESYMVSIPEQVWKISGPVVYYPYATDGTELFVGESTVNVEAVSDENMDWFITQLTELAQDTAECRELAPLVMELLSKLPPALQNNGNAVSQIISLACSYAGVKALPTPSPDALPSDIL